MLNHSGSVPQVPTVFKISFLILFSILLSISITSATSNYIINDNLVYIGDSNVHLSATPHTLSSSGWVYFNLTPKTYSGNIDTVWGFNTTVSRPTRAELYNPHWVNTTSDHEHTFYNVTFYAYSGSSFDYGNVYNSNYSYTVKHEVLTYNETTMEPDGFEFIFSNVAFDSFIKDGVNYTIYWYDKHDKYVLWKDFTHTFNSVEYDYEGYDKWYYVKNVPVLIGQNYTMRAWVDVPVSLTATSGKYYFAVKPSSETISQAVTNGHFYNLDPWWNSSWNYYKTLTINQTMVNQSIGDNIFPMFINITDADLASKAQVDGDDIVFLNAANDTQLAHQIVGTFNSTTGHLQAYVNVTDISNVSSINMYYGNAGATNTENPCGVWGENASGIWLMDEGTGLYVNDSSGNGNNGTLENGVAWGDEGLSFDGNNDYVEVVDSASLDITGNVTFVFDFNPIDVSVNTHRLIHKNGVYSLFTTGSGGQNRLRLHNYNDNSYADTSASLIANESQHITVSKSGGTVNFYRNGVNIDGDTSITPTFPNSAVNLFIGIDEDLSSYLYNGTFSYIYIYNRALSAEDITTRYNNTNSPELFISVGAEQTEAAGITPIITDWNNSKTNNNSLDFVINISESINFNATANQTITTWNWYKDNVDQSHNFDNISLSWNTIGIKNLIVNATNTNGTTNSIQWNVTVESINFTAPTNIQTTPSQTWINITWDAVPNADKYSVYELENGFPYVDIDPVVNGIKDAIYDYAHEFLIFSPNPVSPGDYGTIYPVRTSLGAYLLIECVDNDDKLGDDDTIYYFDLDNDGLTVNDPAWKITNNGIKKYLWDGGSWQVTGVSDAVGASTGGGTHYPIHELFIPIAELGANWINGSTVKVLVKREDSSLSPDVVTWYPYGNINDTDTSLWQEMVLNDPESYILLDNTTNLWYNATGLTPFTIYHGAVSAWNGSVESNYTLFDAITEDLPTYTVSGTVSDSDGNPIAGAIVYSCNGFVHEITTTNVSGYWVGYNFREDNYTICASKAGYYDNSIDIFVDGNLKNQNITLSAVPVIVSKYHKIGEMLFAIPTILKLVFQKIADVIPIFVVLVFIMLIINVIGVAIHAIRVWR